MQFHPNNTHINTVFGISILIYCYIRIEISLLSVFVFKFSNRSRIVLADYLFNVFLE